MMETEHDAATEEVPKLSLTRIERKVDGTTREIRHIAHIQTFILWGIVVDALLLFVIGVELGVIAYLIGR